MDLLRTEAQPVDELLNDGLGVSFVSPRRMPLHRTVPIRDNQGNQARVNVSNLRQTHNGSWLCFATIYDGQLESDQAQLEPVRRKRRFKHGLDVHSDLLPGSSALTIDLSVDGAQLQTSGVLEVGESLELFLDLNDGLEPLSLWSSVRWSRLTPPHSLGVQFLGATVYQRRRLQEFLDWQAGTSGTHRKRRAPRPGMVEQSMFEDVAYQDLYEKEGSVVLVLMKGQCSIELKFDDPEVLRCRKPDGSKGWMFWMREQPDCSLYRFVGENGALLVELRACKPEIVISTIT